MYNPLQQILLLCVPYMRLFLVIMQLIQSLFFWIMLQLLSIQDLEVHFQGEEGARRMVGSAESTAQLLLLQNAWASLSASHPGHGCNLCCLLAGARVNAKDNMWLTPLHRAVASRSEVSKIWLPCFGTETTCWGKKQTTQSGKARHVTSQPEASSYKSIIVGFEP